ncbi:MAG TPA: disulfide bond formation protein B [Gammaproteobacteria bacterium]|nr:disulfide bond formation protein B [Gammaproteobacteria bacterium]
MMPFLSSLLYNRRRTNLLGFLACTGLMAYALYAQFYLHLMPCLLCIFQRIAVIALGLVFLAAFAHDSKHWGGKVYGVLQFLVAAGGSAVALRHIYVQHLPEDLAPPCGPGFGYLFAHLPLSKFLVQVFTGSADCSIVTWTFLGMTMPEWLLAWFLVLGIGGLVMNWKQSAE